MNIQTMAEKVKSFRPIIEKAKIDEFYFALEPQWPERRNWGKTYILGNCDFIINLAEALQTKPEWEEFSSYLPDIKRAREYFPMVKAAYEEAKKLVIK